MSYYDRDRGHRGNYHRGIRVNEQDVPESKHTIFIRGLSGDIQTDEVKDYIEEKIGRVTFDFVKLTKDRSKLFVAVRFESRDEARQFMDKYEDREFMGCRCQLSWFRDIRRFAAFQAAKNIVPRRPSERRRRRSDSDESEHRSSRSSRSPSHSRSRSSRSGSASRSRSPDRRSRSGSRSPRRQPASYNTTEDSERKERRDEHRSRHSSPMEVESDNESRRDRHRKKNRRSRSIDRNSSMDDRRNSKRGRSPSESPNRSKRDETERNVPSSIPMPSEPPKAFIPPPADDSNGNSSNKGFKFNLKGVEEKLAASPLRNTKYVLGLQPDDNTTKHISPEKKNNSYSQPLPPPPLPPPMTKSNSTVNKFEPVSSDNDSRSVIEPKVLENSKNMDFNQFLPNSITSKLFGHLKEFQTKMLNSIKYVEKEEPSNATGLRLSSLANDEDELERKNRIREERLAKLSEEHLLRFTLKKKQLEAAYRSDVETYAFVTTALLSKDASLQSSIKVAFLENMEDLYNKMMDRVDDFLDTLDA